jgi:O-antigen/teichoic acid export membrane protein
MINGKNTILSENKKNVVYSYISQIVSIFTGLILSIVLVRNLELKEFGEYSFLGSVITILGIFVSFGLEGVKQRYITEFLAKKMHDKVNKIIFWTITIRVISLSILSGILVVFYADFTKHFDLSLTFGSFLVFIVIFFIGRLKNLIGPALLVAYLKIYKEKLNYIIYQVMKLILFTTVVSLGYGLSEILISWLIIELVSLMHFSYLMNKKVQYNKVQGPVSKFTRDDKLRMWEFGKYQAFAVVLFMFADIAVDNVMIGYFLGQESVAIYSFALGILMIISKANPSLLLRGMFSTILIKKYTINKSLDDLADSFKLITKLAMVIVIPLYVILGINAENIIILVYSKAYIGALPIIYVGLFFFIFRELTHPFNPLINTLEKNKLFLYTGVFSIYNGLANLFLIPSLGIMGALIATGSACVMIFYFYLYQFKKVFTSGYFPWKSFFKLLMYSVSILLIGLLLNNYITNVISLLIVIIVEIMIFYILLPLFKVFNNSEREILNQQIGKKLRVMTT